MIQSTPSFITSYEAINAKGQREEGTVLAPDRDITKAMEKDGYRSIKIISVLENK